MKPKKIEVTSEMLEQALRCCAKDEPSDSYPCEGCYLYPLSKDGRMSTGQTCFEHLALDVIDHIRRINDFEHSNTERLLAENGELERKNAILKKAVELEVEESYGKPAPQEIIEEIMNCARESVKDG